MTILPSIIETTSKGERVLDPYSRLLKDRIVYLGGQVTDDSANAIVAQLLYLEKENSEEPIKFYINSPGGSVTAGMAIYDTMRIIKSPVHTYGLGMCASMGSFLLSAGEKGHRYALENAEVMIHQPLGGAQGQATEIEIAAKHILRTRERLNRYLSNHTGQPIEIIARDTERDNYMYADEAQAYGLIDTVLTP